MYPVTEGQRARHETHNTAGEADATQTRADVVPDTDASSPDALAYRQLQEEQWDTDHHQQDEVGHQVSSYNGKRSEDLYTDERSFYNINKT